MRERGTRGPLARQRREGERGERGLMVGKVGHHALLGRGDAIAHRRTRMAHERGADAEFADVAFAGRHFVESELARQLVQVHREERRRKVAPQARLEAQRGCWPAPQMCTSKSGR